ncbi:hypothetical protein, partial [Pseudomonas aeruginosa]|uniref:hypothetical protein n=1 Tax=Pseudomonas aeruginosa TaxID=287 RepID=UPI002E764F99
YVVQGFLLGEFPDLLDLPLRTAAGTGEEQGELVVKDFAHPAYRLVTGQEIEGDSWNGDVFLRIDMAAELQGDFMGIADGNQAVVASQVISETVGNHAGRSHG